MVSENQVVRASGEVVVQRWTWPHLAGDCEEPAVVSEELFLRLRSSFWAAWCAWSVYGLGTNHNREKERDEAAERSCENEGVSVGCI